MSLQAKVVNRFKEKEHDDHIYEAGDVYPAEGYKADAERIAFLAEIHPRLKKIFLSDVQGGEKPTKKGKGKAKGSQDEEKSSDEE